jgi:protein SCO1/2
MPGEEGQRHSRGWAGLLPPLLLLVVVLGGFGLLLIHRSSRTSLPGGVQQGPAGGGYDATLARPAKLAPALALRNHLGQSVNLASYRGKAVLVTFLYTNCPDVCPLITEKLRVAQVKLGAKAAQVQIIAVSVDPHGDTPAAVTAFLAHHRMVGRMQYLIGSPAQLGRTWKAWSVGSTREAGNPTQVAHSALVYGITASGKLTTIYPSSFDPSQIVHDVPLLASR